MISFEVSERLNDSSTPHVVVVISLTQHSTESVVLSPYTGHTGWNRYRTFSLFLSKFQERESANVN